MCGIVGIRRFDGRNVDTELLRDMTSRLVHRGPDAEGYWSNGPIGFGHRRLSIIDMAGSSQPMASADGTCHLTFNGEILNYRNLRSRFSYPYQTSGDTETILSCFAARGAAGLTELEGQFALGLNDARDGVLWLARDRVGILPLYYYVDATLLAFASEIKALLPAIPSARVDTHSLDAYLSQRAVAAPYTLFDGIRKLPPAHLLRVGERGIEEPRRYWNFPAPTTLPPSPQEAIEQMATTLREAVASALVADVPVGAYLSGGVDSSLIVAMMSDLRQGSEVKTFSAGFGDPRYDELPYARQVSQLLGTEHHEVAVTADDFRSLWRRLTWHRDAPISEPADIAVFRLAELARRSVTVVLSGEGSDELFGGYPKHRYAQASSLAGVIPATVRSALLGAIERRLPPAAARLRIALRALTGRDEVSRFRGWFSPFTAGERHALLKGAARHPDAGWRQEPEGDALRRMLLIDMQSWLPDNLLERGDRMSMAASLELRPPFLDRRMLELAFSLPSSLKMHKGTTKWLVKQVALRYLPDSIVNRRKVGFRVPLDAWFRDGLEAFAWDSLTAEGSFANMNFDRKLVRQLLERHRNGRVNEENRIWTLLCLEIWYDEFFRSDAGHTPIRH
ncbi:MAG: asparagine synthase (glutamine-hydrolyzing) [Prochlorococcaceae cyanobacterium]